MIQTTATLKVGQKGWDFGSRVPAATIAANGVNCVLRYVSTSSTVFGKPVYSWKSLTPGEVADMHALGIGVIALWEAGGTDPLQGAPKGAAHGAQAIKSCAALGYPVGLPIIPAVDYDVTPANTNASAQYMQGFHGALSADGRWATGIYGDADIIQRCANEGTASIFHMAGAMAWSNRHVIDLAHLLQSISGSTPNWDNNYVLRELDMWLPHDVPDEPIAPAPIPEEDDMPAARIVTLKGYANAYLVGAGPVTYLTAELFASLQADGVKTVEVAPTDLALDQWGIDRTDLVAL